MAERTLADPEYVANLTDALQQALPNAEIRHEQVRRDRYRFIVLSDQFENLGHPERQRIVWDIADKTLEKTDLLNVAMIVTLAPGDYPDTNIIL